jgi:TatD DNase family protein
MQVFDSHCHLTDNAFREDLEAVMDRARAAGVTGIVTIASNADDADAANALASTRDEIWSTAGIHPHEATTAASSFSRIVDAVARPRVVAVGETGLDYHYDNSPRETQRQSFDRHLGLAASTGLPVVVHCREADDDMLDAIRPAVDVTGVLHCFTGTDALLDVALEAGWYISFGGMITFRRWSGEDAFRRVPEDRLLLETDGPYLAPVPHRGKRNEPAYIALTCARAAALRGVDPPTLALVTETNARRFYRIGAP